MEQRRNAKAWTRDILEKTRRAAASSGTIPTCENPEWHSEQAKRLSLDRQHTRSVAPDFRKWETCLTLRSAAEFRRVTGAETPAARLRISEAAVVKWSHYSPPTYTNRASIPGGVAPGLSRARIVPDDDAGSGGFSRGSPVPPPLYSGAAPYTPHFTLVGSQHLDVKGHPNFSTFPLAPKPLPSPLPFIKQENLQFNFQAIVGQETKDPSPFLFCAAAAFSYFGKAGEVESRATALESVLHEQKCI
ncbi:hypothetical protein PR048_010649 [Dryococelus australis]|uniref:Uncharacterized protein n=1 Tax=Dryococelus australis TaxID=614101 RepID=A0ABQ9I395_9NEOP|nr:hypothetical protein PR048_010649 [Dryococelus australis]